MTKGILGESSKPLLFHMETALACAELMGMWESSPLCTHKWWVLFSFTVPSQLA